MHSRHLIVLFLQLAAMAPEEMLNKLRSRAGRWHQLAKLFPFLSTAGFDSSHVDEVTGITPAIQVLSGQCHCSLSATCTSALAVEHVGVVVFSKSGG